MACSLSCLQTKGCLVCGLDRCQLIEMVALANSTAEGYTTETCDEHLQCQLPQGLMLTAMRRRCFWDTSDAQEKGSPQPAIYATLKWNQAVYSSLKDEAQRFREDPASIPKEKCTRKNQQADAGSS